MGGDLSGAEANGTPFANFEHLASGATFLRADLHIHSYGVSTDVTDPAMTAEGVVATAQARGLDLISITDHNAIDSVARLLELAPKSGLVAFPGVELSTGEGHVLVYFSPDDLVAFERWFNRLDFQEDPHSGDRHILTPIHELLGQARDAGGIAVPAHIGRTGTGFEERVSAQLKQAILTSPHLLAVEIDGAIEAAWYSDADTEVGHQQRDALLAKRREALGSESGGRLAKLLFSDAHDLNRIGRDRDEKDRITRIKMSEPSFGAFKTALADPAARIKLEALVPAPYPRIIGARFIGGFLDKQEIAFSSNLTCLIGGRGAGKSTALESIRATCLSAASGIDGKPNCPETVQLVFRDQFGAIHYLKRDSEKATYELGEGGPTATSVAIEGYGQDRVAEIIRGYPEESRPLLAFLDQFVELGEASDEIDAKEGKLKANAVGIAPLVAAPEKKAHAEKALADTKLKLKAIEDSNLKEALAWRRKLQRERQLRERIDARIVEIEGEVNALNVGVDANEMAAEAEVDLATTPSAALLNGEGDDPGVVGILASLGTGLSATKAEAAQHLAAARRELDGRMTAWKQRDQTIEARVQGILDELRKQGIEPDLPQLNRLTQAEAQQIKAVSDADKQIQELNKKRAERRSLIREYREAQGRRYQLRSAAMTVLTGKLNEAFEEFKEFKVDLALREGGLIDSYAAWIRNRIGNRFFQNVRLAEFCQAISPIDLAQALRSRDDAGLLGLTDSAGEVFLDSADQVAQFRSEIGDEEQLMELEHVQRDDFPEITLTTIGQTPQVVRFESLSFGQKASILLAALLFSSEQTPLIIDQPEDHLDSQFISRTVVSVLRRIKEARQVIIATHNANITVLGDAEQIVPMQGYEGKGLIRDVGSVDATATRARACEILEGGEAAYKRRGEMYGFDLTVP